MFETVTFIIAGIPCAILFGLAAYMTVANHYRHQGYEPVIDHDALQAELDAEFSPLSVEQGARFQ